jgi:hypothetical protein
MSETYQDLPTTDMFVHRINNNYYYFDVSIVNLGGRSHTIKPAAIKNLVLEDKFHNFYHSGYIIINNAFDSIERDYTGNNSPSSPSYYTPSSNFQNINNVGSTNSTGNFQSINNTGGTSSQASIPLNGFVFKGDSRDILRIDIMPSLNQNQPGALGSEKEQKVFRMYFDFAIYHSEDIEGEYPDEKLKKLYFWDLYYEIMREQNTYFSTTRYLESDSNIHNLTDTGRAIKTGTAIRELINETFNSSDTGPDRYTAHFAEEPASETDPNWDEGSTSVFFSAPARYKAWDALQYLLERHVSSAESNYDLCFLQVERFPRVFTFRSLKNTFDLAYLSNGDLAGDLYLDTLKIAGFVSVVDENEQRWGYELKLVPKNSLYLDKYGTFRTFNYSDMSGIFSQKELTSRIVHSYDHDNKVFEIDSEDNNFETIRNVFFTNYGSQLKYATVPCFNAGEMRSSRFNVQTDFTTIPEKQQRLAKGRNKSLYAGIFSNNVISFKLPGSTHRQSGTFIGIDRDGAMEASAFDNKILGIYFILEVKHMFQDGEYTNELKCVKTYYANQIDSDVAI